jgi:hypothetical protein
MIDTNLQNYQEFKNVSVETRIHAIIRNKQKQAGDENKKYLSFENNDCYIFGALNIPKFKKYIDRVYRFNKPFLQFSTYQNEVIEIDSNNIIKLQERLEANNLSYNLIEDVIKKLKTPKVEKSTTHKSGLFESLGEILKPQF